MTVQGMIERLQAFKKAGHGATQVVVRDDVNDARDIVSMDFAMEINALVIFMEEPE
jgi:hypothetical protein